MHKDIFKSYTLQTSGSRPGKETAVESTLSALRAMAEPTRLRLVALCAESELTVTELATILGRDPDANGASACNA